MSDEKFDNATLDIVKLAIKKASNGGLEYNKEYRFKLAHIEYLLNGDESPLGDGSQRRLVAYGCECAESLYKAYVKTCLAKKKIPTHNQLIVIQLFLAFVKHLLDGQHKDIAFQYRCYGKFSEDHRYLNEKFGMPVVTIRMITNRKTPGFFIQKDTYIPDDIPVDLKQMLKTHDTVFIIQMMEKNITVHLEEDALLSFCIDYM